MPVEQIARRRVAPPETEWRNILSKALAALQYAWDEHGDLAYVTDKVFWRETLKLTGFSSSKETLRLGRGMLRLLLADEEIRKRFSSEVLAFARAIAEAKQDGRTKTPSVKRRKSRSARQVAPTILLAESDLAQQALPQTDEDWRRLCCRIARSPEAVRALFNVAWDLNEGRRQTAETSTGLLDAAALAHKIFLAVRMARAGCEKNCTEVLAGLSLRQHFIDDLQSLCRKSEEGS